MPRESLTMRGNERDDLAVTAKVGNVVGKLHTSVHFSSRFIANPVRRTPFTRQKRAGSGKGFGRIA